MTEHQDAGTETRHLIIQAARELQLDGLKVEASLSTPGMYEVSWEKVEEYRTDIPMGADFKGIIKALKAKANGQA